MVRRSKLMLAFFIAPHLSRHVLAFSSVKKRVVYLWLQVAERSFTVVSTYGSNGRAEYLAFLEALGEVLEGTPTGDSIVLQGDFNAHVGSNTVTWRGVICCWTFVFSHSLSITNIVFKHKGVHQ